ncbi:MAG: NAD-dependent epimerase/dehydratase family protein, partial [Nitrosopumilaceae archaeon]
MKNFIDSQVLVTGGNGAVGTNLVNKLLTLGAKVTILDDFSQSKQGNLHPSKSLSLIKGDITSTKTLDKVFAKNFDYVFHLAARFANEMSVIDPYEDMRVNVQGTLKILLYCSRQKLERFVYSSSSSLYGQQKATLFKETLLPNPSTPYAASKLTGEHYCRVIHHLSGLNYSILRLSNSYGPFDPPGKFRNVIPNFMLNAIKGKNLVITGTGRETRDFTYIDDTIIGILLAATKKEGMNETFNLGTGKETKIIDVAKLILKITQSKSKLVFKQRRSFDHIIRRRMDISKAKKLLKYNPTVDIKTGL